MKILKNNRLFFSPQLIKLLLFTLISINIMACSEKSISLPILETNELVLLKKANILYTNQDWEEASKLNKEFLKKHPKYFTARLLQAKILFFSGQEKEAIDTLIALTKKYKNYYEAKFWLAKFYYLQENFIEAKTILNELQIINSFDSKVLYLSSIIDIQENKLDKALDKLYKASISREDLALIYYKMSDIFIDIGELPKAEAYLMLGKNIVLPQDVMHKRISFRLQAIEEIKKENKTLSEVKDEK